MYFFTQFLPKVTSLNLALTFYMNLFFRQMDVSYQKIKLEAWGFKQPPNLASWNNIVWCFCIMKPLMQGCENQGQIKINLKALV